MKDISCPLLTSGVRVGAGIFSRLALSSCSPRILMYSNVHSGAGQARFRAIHRKSLRPLKDSCTTLRPGRRPGFALCIKNRLAPRQEGIRPGYPRLRARVGLNCQRTTPVYGTSGNRLERAGLCHLFRASQNHCHRRVPPSQGNIEAGCPACSSILPCWVAHKILSVSALSCQSDKEGRQPGMTRRRDNQG